ncbi:hypothetical protein PCO82_12465 [Pectobacteriaceae bacterium CE90]|nr:hypothetical protein PCO82_12465 [Pectobacteriaceae bacterium CE90]
MIIAVVECVDIEQHPACRFDRGAGIIDGPRLAGCLELAIQRTTDEEWTIAVDQCMFAVIYCPGADVQALPGGDDRCNAILIQVIQRTCLHS